MSQLERSADGLKMNELSRRLMVTGGNVTGIVDQLAREGLLALLAKVKLSCSVPAGRKEIA